MGCCGSKKAQAIGPVPRVESGMKIVRSPPSMGPRPIPDSSAEWRVERSGERREMGVGDRIGERQIDIGAGRRGSIDSAGGSERGSNLRGEGSSSALSRTSTPRSPSAQVRQTTRSAAMEQLRAVSTHLQAGGASMRSFASNMHPFPQSPHQPMLPLMRRMHSRPINHPPPRSTSFSQRRSSSHRRTSSDASSEEDQRSVSSSGAVPDRPVRYVEALQQGTTSSDPRRRWRQRVQAPRSSPPTIKESSLEGSSHGSSRAARELAEARAANARELPEVLAADSASALQTEPTAIVLANASLRPLRTILSSQELPQETYEHVPRCRCRTCRPRAYDKSGALRRQWSTPCEIGCLCPRCLASGIAPAPPALFYSEEKGLLDTPSPRAMNCLGCTNLKCGMCFPEGRFRERTPPGSGSQQSAARRRSGDGRSEASSSSRGETSARRAKSSGQTKESSSRQGSDGSERKT